MGGDRAVFPVGATRHASFLVGNAGSGPDTLVAVHLKSLDLEKEQIWVTVIGWNETGEEARSETRITKCC